MISFEATATSVASPDAVFATWIDVTRWAEGDEIEQATIDRDFGPGAVIRSKAKGLPASKLVVTIVDGPSRWVDESRLPGVRLTFEHIATAQGSGTLLAERVTFTGPLARPVARVVRSEAASPHGVLDGTHRPDGGNNHVAENYSPSAHDATVACSAPVGRVTLSTRCTRSTEKLRSNDAPAKPQAARLRNRANVR